jgi:catechol 2,3-dioxygenase-like lactoylglutathione lyase family enzyme
MPLNRRELLGCAVAAQAVESLCHRADGPVIIDRLDHFVPTVRRIAETCKFYPKVLGMDVVKFGAGRKALRFGQSKINLHEAGREIEPKAERPTPGSAHNACDVGRCRQTSQRLRRAGAHLTHREDRRIRPYSVGLLPRSRYEPD